MPTTSAELEANENTAKSSPTSEMDDSIFPLEIFGEIFNHVASKEKEEVSKHIRCAKFCEEPPPFERHKDMKNLSLVCRAFLPLCRPHLFGSLTIILTTNGPYPSLEKLSDLIKQNPSLLAYTTDITLCVEESTILISEPVLTALTPLFELPNVKHFNINNDERAYSPLLYYDEDNRSPLWRGIMDHFIQHDPEEIAIASMADPPIDKIFSCPSLATLTLKNCFSKVSRTNTLSHLIIPSNLKRFVGVNLSVIPLFILSICPSLEEIDVRNVHWVKARFDQSRLMSTGTFTPFQKLRLFKTQASFDGFSLCALVERAGLDALPALKELDVHLIKEDDVRPTNALLNRARDLKRLIIRSRTDEACSLVPDALEFGKCIYASRSSLQCLCVDVSTKSADDSVSLVMAICDSLESVRGGNKLEEIDLRISCQCHYADILQTPSLSLQAWKRIDCILLGNDRADFPRLRGVTVTWILFVLFERSGIYKGTPNSKLQNALDEQLSGLIATKKFNFTRIVRVHQRGKFDLL